MCSITNLSIFSRLYIETDTVFVNKIIETRVNSEVFFLQNFDAFKL